MNSNNITCLRVWAYQILIERYIILLWFIINLTISSIIKWFTNMLIQKKSSTLFPSNSFINIFRNIICFLCGRDLLRIIPRINAISQSFLNLSPAAIFCFQKSRENATDIVMIVSTWGLRLIKDTLRNFFIRLCDIPLIKEATESVKEPTIMHS